MNGERYTKRDEYRHLDDFDWQVLVFKMHNRKRDIMDANEPMKTLALLSGGLDSTLAVKMVLDMGFEVEAVHFTTPFCICDK